MEDMVISSAFQSMLFKELLQLIVLPFSWLILCLGSKAAYSILLQLIVIVKHKQVRNVQTDFNGFVSHVLLAYYVLDFPDDAVGQVIGICNLN